MLDIVPKYRLIERGELPQAIVGLEAKRREQFMELNRRLSAMASVLNQANAMMEMLWHGKR